jgi:hypothetical protein
MDDITTRLRRWTHDAHAAPASDLMDEAAAEIERLRLTDAEREAIEFAIRKSTRLRDGGKTGAALRGLLERLG